MKWVYASVVAVATGVCSAASSQSIPSLEPARPLFQTVQYDAPNYYGDRGDRYDDDGDRDFRDNDRDRNAGRDQDDDTVDQDDTYRPDTDNDNDRDDAFRDRDDRDVQRGAEYNRGYQDGYRARYRQLSQRANAPVRIDRARFERCTHRYRTFDPATGTYMGFDGRRHVCL